MKEFIDAISQVGFPIVISLLLLLRIEGNQQKFGDRISEKFDKMGERMDKMNDTMKENTQSTDKLAGIIENRSIRRRL